MTGKLMFVPDTHVVVPNGFVSKVGAAYRTTNIVAKEILIDEAIDLLKTPPPDTPPVLRWERVSALGDGFSSLEVGNYRLALTHSVTEDTWFLSVLGRMSKHDSEQEARRAAEKALGIPFEVEEV